MKIKNVSSDPITLRDLPNPFTPYESLALAPGQEFVVVDEDAEKSQDLKAYITAGKISKTGTAEPADGTSVADPDISWILSNDSLIQFLPVTSGDNAYGGAHVAGASVTMGVTNAHGLVDPFNNVTTVVLTASGGTVPKINGLSSPRTLTLSGGKVTVVITDTASGVITLGLSAPTHPSIPNVDNTAALNVSDTATVTLT